MRLSWDAPETRRYSSGLSRGVVYLNDMPGIAWNGLVSVTERDDQTSEARYIDGTKYRNKVSVSGFSGSISAYTYPDELEPYLGSYTAFTAQKPSFFGLSYRNSNEIHLIYNVLLGPSKQSYSTIGASVNPALFEWDFTTQPVKIPGGKPSAHIVILVNDTNPETVTDLEGMIYGSESNDPYLPLVDDLVMVFEALMTYRVIDNGDGTWTGIIPDHSAISLPNGGWQIDWPSAIYLNDVTYVISSS